MRRLVTVLLSATLIAGCSADMRNSVTGSPDRASSDMHVCQVASEIRGDTYARTRERVTDLYNSYGETVSPGLATPLRDWSSGLKEADVDLLLGGVAAVGNFCIDHAYPWVSGSPPLFASPSWPA